jgi:hypothetical protein
VLIKSFIIIIIIIIIIINFKLRVGFHPVAVALQNDTQIKHNKKQTNKLRGP